MTYDVRVRSGRNSYPLGLVGVYDVKHSTARLRVLYCTCSGRTVKYRQWTSVRSPVGTEDVDVDVEA